MGSGIVVKCSNCEDSKEYILGAGMQYFSLANVTSNLHWRNRNKIEEFKHKGEIIFEDFEHRIYQCEKCNSVYSRFWVKLERDDGEVFETRFKCPKCRVTLVEADNGFRQYNCSVCGKKMLSVESEILWD